MREPPGEAVFPFPNLAYPEDFPQREAAYIAIISLMMVRFPEGVRLLKSDLLNRQNKMPSFEVSEPVPGELALTIRRESEWGS